MRCAFGTKQRGCEDPKSKSRDVAESGVLQALGAGLWTFTILVCGVFLGLKLMTALLIVGALVLVGSLWGLYIHRRVGGLAGDFLGATQQLSEIAILLVLATA